MQNSEQLKEKSDKRNEIDWVLELLYRKKDALYWKKSHSDSISRMFNGYLFGIKTQ